MAEQQKEAQVKACILDLAFSESLKWNIALYKTLKSRLRVKWGEFNHSSSGQLWQYWISNTLKESFTHTFFNCLLTFMFFQTCMLLLSKKLLYENLLLFEENNEIWISSPWKSSSFNMLLISIRIFGLEHCIQLRCTQEPVFFGFMSLIWLQKTHKDYCYATFIISLVLKSCFLHFCSLSDVLIENYHCMEVQNVLYNKKQHVSLKCHESE